MIHAHDGYLDLKLVASVITLYHKIFALYRVKLILQPPYIHTR